MTPGQIAAIAIPCLSAFAGMVWWFFRAPVESGAEAERPAKYETATETLRRISKSER